MESLNISYSIEIDRMAKAEWSEYLLKFEDATIYQTWSYGAVRWGVNNLSHLVLKKGEEIVGLAQVSIKKIPFLEAGIAYIPWGPMWRSKDRENEISKFGEIIRALKNEYAIRRGLLLRIAPNEIDGDDNKCTSILESEGFVRRRQHYRTLLIELSASMDELYKGLARRWKRALKTAESKKLRVSEGDNEEFFEAPNKLYKDMVSRKGFVPGVDIDEFRAIQKDLPETLKMKIMTCEYEGKPVSALMASLIGNKGIGLIGGTGTVGLNLGGFHLLNWKMIEWMKSEGANWYDFGGYDPKGNPGTASFKDGLPGQDLFHIGQWETCTNQLSSSFVRLGEWGKNSARAIHAKWDNLRKKPIKKESESKIDANQRNHE